MQVGQLQRIEARSVGAVAPGGEVAVPIAAPRGRRGRSGSRGSATTFVAAAPGAAAEVQTLGLSTKERSTVARDMATMEKRFIPSKAAGVNAVVQFDIGGPGGGMWYCIIRGGKCKAGMGKAPEKPTLAFKADIDVWIKVNRGDMSGTLAVLTGKLKVDGDRGLAKKLGSFFKDPPPA